MQIYNIMRQRNKVWAKPYIEESPFVIHFEEKLNDNLASYFENGNQEVRLEIGVGKGDFILGLAKKNPDINFIGIEVVPSVLVTAIQKVEELELHNVKFILFDATTLETIFPRESITTLYLNFSDPWPKKRHAKRRLTSKKFLDMYNIILKQDGYIIQKTDNQGLFLYSLDSYKENDFEVESVDFDYQFDELNDSMSEYERKFRELNNPIYRVIVKNRRVDEDE